MGFRLVPKSGTLSNLERRNRLFCVILPISVALWPITQKCLKTDRYCLRQKCSPENLVFSNTYGDIHRIYSTESINERHPLSIKGDNSTDTA